MADIMMNIGEALVGEGNEIAHIDLLIGDKTGPVGHRVRQRAGQPVGTGTPTCWPC